MISKFAYNSDPVDVSPSIASPRREKLDALTGIRFFAATAVILRHFQSETFADFPWFQRIGGQGYLAVGFFFVLSGFVLSYNYITPARGLRGTRREFWAARFARIYPAYLAAFLLALPLFALAVSQYHSVGATLARLAVGGTLVLLLVQSWIPIIAGYVNSPAWSLSVEAFFYFAFPFCLPRVAWLSPRGCLVAILLLWATALAMPLMVFAWLQIWPFGTTIAPDSLVRETLQSLPPLRMPEFLMGMVLGHFFLLKRSSLPKGNSAWPSAMAVLVLLALSFTDRVPESLVGNGLLAPLFMLLIWTIASSSGLFIRFLSSRLIVWLGEISYGIYIFQEPVARWFEKLAGRSAYDAFFAYFLVLILSAGFSHHFIESPIRRLLKARLRRSWQVKGDVNGAASS